MRRTARLALVVSLALAGAPRAHGQDGTQGDANATARPAASGGAPLNLDKLLNPRVGEGTPAATKPGGKDRDTWRKQFDDAYAEVRQLRAKVDESQRKMRSAAGDANYSYSPTGGAET